MNSKIKLIIASVVVVVLFAGLFASCTVFRDELGLGSKDGLSYNKLSISEKDIDADLEALAKNEPLNERFKEADEPLTEDGKVTPTYRASWVNILMRTLSIKEVRLEKKLKITEADRKSALEDSKNLFQGQDEDSTNEIWEAFPESFRDRLVENIAEQYALKRLAPKVSDKEIQTFFDENQDTLAPACESGKSIAHVLVADEKTAKDIEKKIKEGEDFAELAEKNSQDPGSKDKGGDLGCFVPGNFVAEFEAAAAALTPGSVSAIVKTDFGYHILKATTYKPPTLEESRDTIIDQLKPEKESKIFDEVETNLKKAKISVLSKYGRVEKQDGIPAIVPLKKDTPSTSAPSSNTNP